MKRYDFGRDHANNIGAPAITEQPNGAYVRHDDYLALADEWRAEKAALEQIVMTQEVAIAEFREGMEAIGAGGVSLMGGASAWQPIETAPKDGTVIDLWHNEFGRFPDGYWGLPQHCCGEMGSLCDSEWHGLEPGWVDEFNEMSWAADGFAHWMPLPEAPCAALTQQEQGK